MTNDYIYCTQCGTKNKIANKYCTKCGNNLHTNEVVNESPDEQTALPVEETITEPPESGDNTGRNTKLIGIITGVVFLAVLVFVYIQRSDHLFNPLGSKEEIWVSAEENNYLGQNTAIKIINQEEAWLMEEYQEDSFDAGISNFIYDIAKTDSTRDDVLTLKSTNLKKIEMFRLPPMMWTSNQIYYTPFDLEIFDIDSDYLDTEESYWNQVIDQYLDMKTFEKVVGHYDSISEYMDKKVGTKEEQRRNISELLSEYIEENAEDEGYEEITALRKELTEAVIEENKAFIEEKIQVKRLDIARDMGEDSIMSEDEIASLQEEMRAKGLEYDEFYIEPQIYLDEENLNLVVGIADLSKSAQFVFQEGDDFIFEILPVEHPENNYEEEILIVYLENDVESTTLFFKHE